MALLAWNDPKALTGASSESQSCLHPHSSWREENRWGDSLRDRGRILGDKDKGGKR